MAADGATHTSASSPDLYQLELELSNPDTTLADYLTKLDKRRSINSKDPKIREIYNYIFLVVDQLSRKIEELDPRFKTKVSPTCGSAFDNTKVGACDEFDFLLILESLSDFNTRSSFWNTEDRKNVYLQVQDHERWKDCLDEDNHHVNPTLIHKRFAALVDQAMKDLPLPAKLKHGGFASPKYSGVRPHRFAHLLQLIWFPTRPDTSLFTRFTSLTLGEDSTSTGSFVITLDLTLVLIAPPDLTSTVLVNLEHSHILGSHYKSLLRYILDYSAKVKQISNSTQETQETPHVSLREDHTQNLPFGLLDIDYGVHMIPSRQQGWVLTTAGLDHSIMSLFSDDSQLKRCIRLGKILNGQFLTLWKENAASFVASNHLGDHQDRWKSHIQYLVEQGLYHGLGTIENPYRFLVDFLQYENESICPEILHMLNEYSPPTCSGSSGFIKYLTIQLVCSKGLTEEAFQDSDRVDPRFILEVLRRMGEPNEGVPHPVLPRNLLWPVSIHKYYSSSSMRADYMMNVWQRQYAELMRVLNNAS